MTEQIDHPGVRWLRDPVDRVSGIPSGGRPRMRHHEDCMHFYRDENGEILGPPAYPASEEQMRTLPACQTCVGETDGSGSSTATGTRTEARGAVCPTCSMEMSVSGVCSSC